MSAFAINIRVESSVACIMILVLLACLYHTLAGNRNKWLIAVLSMLLLSNVGTVVMAVGSWRLLGLNQLTYANAFLDGFGAAV
jgi:hypothetical protein